MYQSHWNLTHRPFEHSLEPRFYYPCEAHQAALLKLRYAIENRRGLALLSGAGGSGKTLLVQTLGRHLSPEFSPLVRLVFPQMPTADLLTYLADELGAEPPVSPVGQAALLAQSVEQSVRRIQKFLADNAARGNHAVVAIDEAHLLDDLRTLESLRLLLNFETDARPQITFLLVGQPALLSAVERLPQVEERLGAKCLLPAFTLEQTISYVNHRLNAAGCTRSIFDTEALEELHAASHGLARRINRLADLALLVGFAEELHTIGKAQIENLAEELTLPSIG